MAPAFLFSACGTGQKEVAEKPLNIIHIMTDDHSYQTISAYGHALGKLAPTPNLDRLAAEGMLFRQAFVENSLSTPSRACLMTGLYSHQNGQRQLGKGIDTTKVFFSEILQQHGYQTGVVGKWHMQCEPKGFDYYHVLWDQGDYYNPYFITEGDTARHKGYVTDLITQYCEDWMSGREDKNKPFFLMMHHKAVHRNWVPAERHYHLYEHTQFPLPDNYYDAYEGRYAAQMQKMNIYRDMYEGHDLKMVAGMNSDSLLFDPWPHAFLGTMEPDERRRFMDVVISQYDKEYLDALIRYNKALAQRNTLLKSEFPVEEELFLVWEEMMAQAGEVVFRKREAVIKEFIPIFQSFYSFISQDKESVGLSYESHARDTSLLDVLKQSRERDKIMGFSLRGIHKDELNMLLGEFPIKKEGSQGQNKTYLVALKLAQFDFLKRTGRTVPLLLLDDIFDKLDASRVEQIVKLVAGDSFGQIFITDTNREHLDRILHKVGSDYKIFRVEQGVVREMEAEQ